MTETGIPCQIWASQSPHQHTLGDDAGDFQDGEMPANYCRSTLGEDGRPWCYTSNEDVDWEYCDVPQCSCTGDFVVYGSSCYAYVNTPASWLDAKTQCSSLGGFLAEVQAFDQSDFLQELTVGVSGLGPTWGAWLGGTNDGLSGQWAWALTGKAMTYTNWAQDEPTNLGSQPKCLQANQHTKWIASGCSTETGFICQKKTNELPNDDRNNILANVVDQNQATLENMAIIIQELIEKENELDDAIQDERHIESGTFQCGTFRNWTSDPVQTHEETFSYAYLTPPIVHVSLATLNTNVNQRHLDVSFSVNGTTNTGFTVVCENHAGHHYSELWELDLTWISISET